MADVTETITADELKRLRAKGKKAKAKHKFNAQPTVRDGIRFDSKLEARYYDLLVTWKAAGLIVGFLRQVPFDLGGGTKYRVDFQVFHADGHVIFVDVKGKETKAFLKAKRQVEAREPWIGEIHVVKADHITNMERFNG